MTVLLKTYNLQLKTVFMSTIFTKIINREIPAFVVYETQNTLAFLDINPNVDGHTLVIHKQEFKNIFDIPDDILQELIASVKHVSSLLKDKLGAEGVNIYSNHGEAAGQEVPHLHFHIIPRYKGDKIHATKGFYDKKEKNVMKKLEEVFEIINAKE